MSYRAGLERLLSLPVSVDAVVFEPRSRGGREATVVRVSGDGVDGLGEDVTHDRPDRRAFQRVEMKALLVEGRLGSVLERLEVIDLASGVSHEVVASYRRWAVESALIDLALGQNGVGLQQVFGLEPR